MEDPEQGREGWIGAYRLHCVDILARIPAEGEGCERGAGSEVGFGEKAAIAASPASGAAFSAVERRYGHRGPAERVGRETHEEHEGKACAGATKSTGAMPKRGAGMASVGDARFPHAMPALRLDTAPGYRNRAAICRVGTKHRSTSEAGGEIDHRDTLDQPVPVYGKVHLNGRCAWKTPPAVCEDHGLGYSAWSPQCRIYYDPGWCTCQDRLNWRTDRESFEQESPEGILAHGAQWRQIQPFAQDGI